MQLLVIGGTRNVGHDLALELLRRGHQVTVLNRGRTPDDLPLDVERLHADRSDPGALAAALGDRSWESVVDMTLYNGRDAAAAVQLFRGRVGHYVFVSTGQVYLVRVNAPRPAREEDYAGPVMAPPPEGTRDWANWLYGVQKREAEDVLFSADLPFTTLRLPMVNSERDHYGRLHGYLLRLADGGPILVPSEPGHALRHVYGSDVVRIIGDLLERGAGKGSAWNLSHDETVTLDEFLETVAELAGLGAPRLVRKPRAELEAAGLFPACSPFSDSWMSALDNARAKAELGVRFTPFRDVLAHLVRHYMETNPPPPEGYSRRHDETEGRVDG